MTSRSRSFTASTIARSLAPIRAAELGQRVVALAHTATDASSAAPLKIAWRMIGG